MKLLVNQTTIVLKNDEVAPIERAIEYYALREYPRSQRAKLSVLSTESGRSRDNKSFTYYVDILGPLTQSTRQFLERKVVVVEI